MWSERLVLLCGPPCAGKTAYCHAQGGSHVRVSSEDGDKSAHYLQSKKVARSLGKGEKVVVDDQNWSSQRRAVLLKAADRAAGALCVWCLPLGGRLQCEWANEWSMAEIDDRCEEAGYRPLAFLPECAARAYASPSAPGSEQHCRHRALEPWCSAPNESGLLPAPTEASLLSEGFTRVLIERLPFRPDLHASFTTAALIVDAQSLFERSGAAIWPLADAGGALSRWLSDSPGGRLIVVVHAADMFPAGPQEPRQQEAHVCRALRDLSSRLRVRTQLYYLFIAAEPPPSPELHGKARGVRWLASARSEAAGPEGRMPSLALAWLVRRHRIALDELVFVSPARPAAAALRWVKWIDSEEFLFALGDIRTGSGAFSPDGDLPLFLRPFTRAACSGGAARGGAAEMSATETSCAELPLLGGAVVDGEARERACGRLHGVFRCDGGGGADGSATRLEAPQETAGAAVTAARGEGSMAAPPPPERTCGVTPGAGVPGSVDACWLSGDGEIQRLAGTPDRRPPCTTPPWQIMHRRPPCTTPPSQTNARMRGCTHAHV